MKLYSLLIVAIATMGTVTIHGMDSEPFLAMDYSTIANESLHKINRLYNTNVKYQDMCAAVQLLYHIPALREYIKKANTENLYPANSVAALLMQKILALETSTEGLNLSDLEVKHDTFWRGLDLLEEKALELLKAPFFYLIQMLQADIDTSHEKGLASQSFLKKLFSIFLSKNGSATTNFSNGTSKKTFSCLNFKKNNYEDSLDRAISDFIQTTENAYINTKSDLLISVVNTPKKNLFGESTQTNPIPNYFGLNTGSYTNSKSGYGKETISYELIGLHEIYSKEVYTRYDKNSWVKFSTQDATSQNFTNEQLRLHFKSNLLIQEKLFLLIYQLHTPPVISPEITATTTALTTLSGKLEVLKTQLNQLKSQLADLKSAAKTASV